MQKNNQADLKPKENIIYTIVNPMSSNGKTGKRWPRYRQKFKEAGLDLHIKETHYPGHAVNLTKNGLNKGYKTIMAVGGDGTVNEIVNGFFDNGQLIEEDAVLLIFSQGTGSDYVKSLGLDKKIETVIDVYNRYQKKWVDLGKIKYNNFDQKKTERYFVNTADVGIGGETVEYVNRASKLMGGVLTYLFGAIRTLIRYENKVMKLDVDQKLVKNNLTNSVMVSLGKYFAGGMPIAPEAEIDDGFFDILILGDLTKAETLLNLYKAYQGTHLDYPKIDYLKGKDVKIESEERVLIDIDGESAGMLPAEFTILKERFPVLA
ncbi:MAG: diacylglycerol kinase family lipid kinase [Halanaerobiales bacterium]